MLFVGNPLYCFWLFSCFCCTLVSMRLISCCCLFVELRVFPFSTLLVVISLSFYSGLLRLNKILLNNNLSLNCRIRCKGNFEEIYRYYNQIQNIVLSDHMIFFFLDFLLLSSFFSQFEKKKKKVILRLFTGNYIVFIIAYKTRRLS